MNSLPSSAAQRGSSPALPGWRAALRTLLEPGSETSKALGHSRDTSAVAPYTVTLVPERDLPGLRPAWRALADRAVEPNAYYEPAFVDAALHHLRQARGTRIAAIWHAGPGGPLLVGLLPLRLSRHRWGVPVRLVLALAHDWGPLGTPLLDPEHAAPAAASLIAWMRDGPLRARLAMMPLLPRDGAAAAALAEALHNQGLAWTVHGAHERALAERPQAGDIQGDTVSRLPTRRRKEIQRQARRLKEMGQVEGSVVADPVGGPAVLADFLHVERSGWKGRRGSAALSRPADHAFLHAAVTGMLADGRARLHRLTLDGRTIAAGIAFVSGRRGWYWKTAYDESLARLSPGVQLTAFVTDDLLGPAGLDSVDSSAIPGHPMIDHVWPGRLAVEDWLIDLKPGSSLGRMAAQLEDVRRQARTGLRNTARTLLNRLRGSA